MYRGGERKQKQIGFQILRKKINYKHLYLRYFHHSPMWRWQSPQRSPLPLGAALHCERLDGKWRGADAYDAVQSLTSTWRMMVVAMVVMLAPLFHLRLEISKLHQLNFVDAAWKELNWWSSLALHWRVPWLRPEPRSTSRYARRWGKKSYFHLVNILKDSRLEVSSKSRHLRLVKCQLDDSHTSRIFKEPEIWMPNDKINAFWNSFYHMLSFFPIFFEEKRGGLTESP